MLCLLDPVDIVLGNGNPSIAVPVLVLPYRSRFLTMIKITAGHGDVGRCLDRSHDSGVSGGLYARIRIRRLSAQGNQLKGVDRLSGKVIWQIIKPIRREYTLLT